MNRMLLLASVLATSALAAAPPADMEQRLAACATCHGAHGEGTGTGEYLPHLSGKPAGYLREQLQAFRDGRRQFAQMTWLVRNMDDDALAAMSDFYAALPPLLARQSTGTGQSAERDARARQLVHEGDAAQGVPACAACHGDTLAGLEPGVPALLGLPADYVIAQLGAWRSGVRNSVEPDCMETIALALSGADLRALGNWLAAQEHPVQQRPAPEGSLEPPIACGSIPPLEPAAAGGEEAPGDAGAPAEATP